MKPLTIGGHTFTNRLFTGTGKFSSKKLIPEMIAASGTQMITVALRRVNFNKKEENIIRYIPSDVVLLPNTSGARTADEAVRIARIARGAGLGNFIKIEVIKDSLYLMPDNHETLAATTILAEEGFTVLPYILPDPVITRQLEEAGAAAVMPLGSPIGSNQGLKTRSLIEMIIERARVPVVVDAGIGKPSHAAEAMEMGADAVLVNTAISTTQNPAAMAKAFSLAVQAGRMAFEAQFAAETQYANPSSPLTGFLRDEHEHTV